jgi:hypothetical protein
MKLNLMISHRLTDDYVIVDLFSFDYDLLKSFCFVCKNFLLTSFMNENEVFPFKKKKNTLLTNIYTYMFSQTLQVGTLQAPTVNKVVTEMDIRLESVVLLCQAEQ